MEILFTIAPGYLHAVARECQGYNFRVQGYSDFDRALERLYTTNIGDVLGYLCIAESLDDVDVESLERFIYVLDNMSGVSKKTLLFVFNDTSALKSLISKLEVKNLNISCTADFEALTDVVIRVSVASILRDSKEPYLGEEKSSLNLLESKELRYNSLFSKRLYKVFDPVKLHGDKYRTFYEDAVLLEFEGDELYTFLRRCFILAHYGDSLNWDYIFDLYKYDYKIYSNLLLCKSRIDKLRLEVLADEKV